MDNLSLSCDYQMVSRGSANLLRPRQTKYRKVQKNNRAVIPATTDKPDPPTPKHKQYGIYALDAKKIKAAQLEAGRLALVRAIGQRGSAVRRIAFPHIPVTKKPLGSRMGKGKGAVEYFVSYVKPGKMLYEFDATSNQEQARRAVQFKLPIRVGLVEKT